MQTQHHPHKTRLEWSHYTSTITIYKCFSFFHPKTNLKVIFLLGVKAFVGSSAFYVYLCKANYAPIEALSIYTKTIFYDI